MTTRRNYLAALSVGAVSALAGCGLGSNDPEDATSDGSPTSDGGDTPTVTPTATLAPTDGSGAADDGTPTSTPSPTETATPSSTETPTPSPTATRTPPPTATAERGTQLGKVTAADGERYDEFGSAVATDGSTALVGAPGDDNGDLSGAAYVFEREGGAWRQRSRLAPDPAAVPVEDTLAFGGDVALAADRAVVGAVELSGPNALGSGVAYVYERRDGDWERAARLRPAADTRSDEFGAAVALSGDTVLVGAYEGETVYAFGRDGDDWVETATLRAADPEEHSHFGEAVALDGDTALVGAGDRREAGERVGKAYVFTRADDGWEQAAELVPAGSDDEDYVGRSVALAGDTALVAAPGDDDPDGPYAGSATVFERSGGEWTEVTTFAPPEVSESDIFGSAVALSDGRALVGAEHHPNANGQTSGGAYLFGRADGEWSRRAKLLAEDGDNSDLFGDAVALSTDRGLVGAPGEEGGGGEDTGAVYVFAA